MIHDIGSKINQLRTEQSLTLKQLAEKSGLSVAFLSQIERGLASPAIISLNSIADALGVELSYFFNVPKRETTIVTRSYETIPFVLKHTNYVYSEISQHFEGRAIDILLVTLIPGSEENYPALGSHVGEDFIYVLEGVVTLLHDGKEYELFPGDSSHYKADVPHSWKNRTNKLAKIISVSTPIIFREYTK